jgi:protein-disulfide isomerase
MAQSVNLKPFYLVFGAVVLAGAAWIWSSRSGGEAIEVGPMPLNATAFPGWVLGSDSAPVEIVEYADFECPACGHFAILTAPDVKTRLVASGRVRFRFRDFPLDGHANSPAAHLAGACAGEQGRFWEMADQLFYQQREWVPERRPMREFRRYADAIGLDVDQWEACMKEGRSAGGKVAAGKQEGIAIGVQSTPSFVIGGLLVAGSLSYDSIVSLVERAEARLAQ